MIFQLLHKNIKFYLLVFFELGGLEFEITFCYERFNFVDDKQKKHTKFPLETRTHLREDTVPEGQGGVGSGYKAHNQRECKSHRCVAF